MTTTEIMQKAEFVPHEYRVYRTISGRFEAQVTNADIYEWKHIPNEIPGYGVLSVWIPPTSMPDFPTEKEAEAACHTHAAKRKQRWKKEQAAGVVKYLGKLP